MGKNACLGGQKGGSSQWPSCAGEDWRSSLGPLAPGTQTAARRPVDELRLGQIKQTEKIQIQERPYLLASADLGMNIIYYSRDFIQSYVSSLV